MAASAYRKPPFTDAHSLIRVVQAQGSAEHGVLERDVDEEDANGVAVLLAGDFGELVSQGAEYGLFAPSVRSGIYVQIITAVGAALSIFSSHSSWI